MVVINVYSKLGPKVGSEFLASLEKEGIVFDSKKVWVTFEAYDFKGPGISVSGKKQLSRGQVIMTQKCFVAIVGGYKLIDVPRNYHLTINRSNPKRYIIELDLSKIQTNFTGKIVLSYHLDPSKVLV